MISKRTKPRRKRPELFSNMEKRMAGAREWRAISKRLRLKWWEQSPNLRCGICGKFINRFADLVPDHINPGKMGGCRDHSESNLQPAHFWCNNEKGSKRNYKKPSIPLVKSDEGSGVIRCQ